jgi:hypothetical protein
MRRSTGTGTVTENPLYVDVADCSGSAPCWTNYELQSTSPAIGAGAHRFTRRWTLPGKRGPSRPAIGALEYGSASSEVQVTVSAVAKSGDSGATGYPDGYGRANWQLEFRPAASTL